MGGGTGGLHVQSFVVCKRLLSSTLCAYMFIRPLTSGTVAGDFHARKHSVDTSQPAAAAIMGASGPPASCLVYQLPV